MLALLALTCTIALLARSAAAVSRPPSQPLTQQRQVVNLRVQNHRLRRHLAAYGRWVRRLQSENLQLRRQAEPGWHVQNALRLASRIWRVSYSELRAVGSCESHLWPYARNGQYRGIFQEGPMFERGPFGSLSVWDPYANVFTAAFTVAREGWSQWECRP